MDDESSLTDLLDPGRLGRIVPSPGHHRPRDNVIQPIADFQEPIAILPGPEHEEKEIEGRVGGNDDGKKTVASVDDDEDAGYSSGREGDDKAN